MSFDYKFGRTKIRKVGDDDGRLGVVVERFNCLILNVTKIMVVEDDGKD